MKVLFDQNAPDNIAGALVGHEVTLARELGWGRLSNGVLLAAAEKRGFQLFLTCDQNIRYQQNLSSRQIAIVQITTNHWPSIKPHCVDVLAAVNEAKPGSYAVVEIRDVRRQKRF